MFFSRLALSYPASTLVYSKSASSFQLIPAAFRRIFYYSPVWSPLSKNANRYLKSVREPGAGWGEEEVNGKFLIPYYSQQQRFKTRNRLNQPCEIRSPSITFQSRTPIRHLIHVRKSNYFFRRNKSLFERVRCVENVRWQYEKLDWHARPSWLPASSGPTFTLPFTA